MHKEMTEFLLISGRQEHDDPWPFAIMRYGIEFPNCFSFDQLTKAGFMSFFDATGQPHQLHLFKNWKYEIHKGSLKAFTPNILIKDRINRGDIKINKAAEQPRFFIFLADGD